MLQTVRTAAMQAHLYHLPGPVVRTAHRAALGATAHSADFVPGSKQLRGWQLTGNREA